MQKVRRRQTERDAVEDAAANLIESGSDGVAFVTGGACGSGHDAATNWRP